MTRATCTAHPNIALVKYWGKADAALNLPATGSLSMTLDVFPTVTTVTVDDALARDEFVLGGEPQSGVPAERVTRFLDLVRAQAGSAAHARVESRNDVPSAAGLASSASGFAALAGAAAAAYGLDLDPTALSRLARRGSGSASRSVFPGFALWRTGDDAHSVAEPVRAPDMAMVIAIVDRAQKPVSSREAMRRTRETSPYYPAWVSSTAETLEAAIAACAEGDLERLGALAETNAMRMHAAIQACDPPIRYLTATSVALFDRVAALRAHGVRAWATADAGPNVVAMCHPDDVAAVRQGLGPLAELVVARPGPGLALHADADG
ncbi:diphosphomevalonate decarboxylase [Microbacterium sp. No. 7]|uniref:diphosphomevalonate decarboxylase n=1 Tax=Microbacterium sp. No. 7 TaxID=1714373 RepID=UPI0006D08250|nr:diphosphomevalonate decarboxylase [Microbacterium sp. No. 7]ALJ20176.1 dihydrofolate reductase [Microbacterium sp. No. 7]